MWSLLTNYIFLRTVASCAQNQKNCRAMKVNKQTGDPIYDGNGTKKLFWCTLTSYSEQSANGSIYFIYKSSTAYTYTSRQCNTREHCETFRIEFRSLQRTNSVQGNFCTRVRVCLLSSKIKQNGRFVHIHVKLQQAVLICFSLSFCTRYTIFSHLSKQLVISQLSLVITLHLNRFLIEIQ